MAPGAAMAWSTPCKPAVPSALPASTCCPVPSLPAEAHLGCLGNAGGHAGRQAPCVAAQVAQAAQRSQPIQRAAGQPFMPLSKLQTGEAVQPRQHAQRGSAQRTFAQAQLPQLLRLQLGQQVLQRCRLQERAVAEAKAAHVPAAKV